MLVRRSLLMPYPAESMFDLIEQAEYYPQFIPWCTEAVILERTDEMVAARIAMRVAGLTLSLQTRNPKRRPEWLALRMVRGPLRRFEGEWRLTPLNASACRIEFTLTYEFADRLIERVAGPVFARMADTMVDAYVSRAERILPAAAPAAVQPAEEIMNDQPMFDALRPSKLAVELTDEQCHRLAAAMQLRDLKAGEVLVKEGDDDHHFYLIVRGKLGVIKSAGTAEQVTLNTLAGGDFAGELSWLDGSRRYASLVAMDDARVLGLEREKLEALLQTDAQVVYRVMRAIVRAVHQIQRQLYMQQGELTNYIYKQHGRY
ncbi:MAG: cyclic nucleotide-binding domain-containing protein [Burkholderiales bacterium]|nr:MAG: cyclic nucleotide-binding domain-containing protein [Burkholderiales bacterium]